MNVAARIFWVLVAGLFTGFATHSSAWGVAVGAALMCVERGEHRK